MMKNKILCLLFLSTLVVKRAHAQTDSLFWNKDMIKIAVAGSNADWIDIRQDITIEPLTFFAKQKKALNLGSNDDMRLTKTEKDKTGFTHYRFQQYYKSYRITGAEFLLHEKGGRLISANGKLIIGLTKNPLISIIKEQALQYALRSFPSAKYAWEIPVLEEQKKQLLHDTNATFKPIGELVWLSTTPDDNIKNPDSYLLSYQFDIYHDNLNGKRIFIDASNGKLIKAIPLVSNCTPTSVVTNFYGVQGFSTKLIPASNPPTYNLWNDCQAAFIRTRLWNVNLAIATDYTSGLVNSWGAASSAATSHWCTERSYNYFLGIHGRQGWNNANGGVNIYQDALFCDSGIVCTLNNPNNASFGNGFMQVGNSGNGNAIDDWNSLDIIAHEFAHGVTESSANLVYSREPGALNESFSDIFGASCHASLFGLTSNTWLVGFDRKNPDNISQSLYIRNMSNPNDRGQPDTYLSAPLWVSTTTPTDVGGDNWGVHTNSGVQNYMYYLLVGGGSGINDNGTAFSLVGIGIVAARHLAYRVLTIYLTSSSTYADARRAWVRAAEDEYGVCSFQAIETGKAWDAVGISPPLNNTTTNFCGIYGGSVLSLVNAGIYSLAPGCVMTVNPANLVQFGARKVVLNPGFRAQNGSKFRAYVSDCRFAAY